GLQHHALTAAERPVINRLMPVVCERSQVVDPRINRSTGPAAPDDAVLERPVEEFRENRDDIEDHHLFKSRRPFGNSTSIRRAARSTFFTIDSAKGISVSSLPLPICRSCVPPPSTISVTSPIYSFSAPSPSLPWTA